MTAPRTARETRKPLTPPRAKGLRWWMRRPGSFRARSVKGLAGRTAWSFVFCGTCPRGGPARKQYLFAALADNLPARHAVRLQPCPAAGADNEPIRTAREHIPLCGMSVVCVALSRLILGPPLVAAAPGGSKLVDQGAGESLLRHFRYPTEGGRWPAVAMGAGGGALG